MHWIWFIVITIMIVVIFSQRKTIKSLKKLRDEDNLKFNDLKIDRDNLWRKLDSIENPYENLKNQIKEDQDLDILLGSE